MISGNPAITVKKYKTLDEVDATFSDFFSSGQSGE